MQNLDRVAIYPGTFDPVTLGHEDIVARAVSLFDKVIVAVAKGHHKNPMLPIEQRLTLVKQVMYKYHQDKVQVLALDGLLANFALKHKAKVILRGIRAVSDFDYEFQMAGMNQNLMPKVETVFMVPKNNLQFISGTFIREIFRLGGDISKFVSPEVLINLQQTKANLFNQS